MKRKLYNDYKMKLLNIEKFTLIPIIVSNFLAEPINRTLVLSDPQTLQESNIFYPLDWFVFLKNMVCLLVKVISFSWSYIVYETNT